MHEEESWVVVAGVVLCPMETSKWGGASRRRTVCAWGTRCRRPAGQASYGGWNLSQRQ